MAVTAPTDWLLAANSRWEYDDLPYWGGGWNCEWVNGSPKSSFHSTLNALKGLLDYEQVTGDRERVSWSRPGRCTSHTRSAGSTAC